MSGRRGVLRCGRPRCGAWNYVFSPMLPGPAADQSCIPLPERSVRIVRRVLKLMVTAAAAAGLVLSSAGAVVASPACTAQVRVSPAGAVRLPGALPSGFLKFVVSGPRGQNIQVALPTHHASVATLVADANAINTAGDPTHFERDFVQVGGTLTGSDVWMQLRPGTYYVFDSNAVPLTVSDVAMVHVGGPSVQAEHPSIAARIDAIDEHRWADRPRSIPHEGVLQFVNQSSGTHFVDLTKLKQGVTRQQVLDVLRGDADPSTILDPSGAFYDSGTLSPHRSQLSTYDLPRGHYSLISYFPNEHGVPQGVLGMVRVIDLR